MRRGTKLAAICVMLLATTYLGSDAPRARGQEPVPAERPNILVVLTDDQRATGTMQAMRKTLRIFRREGVEYPNAFATTPLCCPARISLMTGRYAHNHGVQQNDLRPEFDHDTTIQHYLAEAGYYNGYFGKFANGWDLAVPPPDFVDFATFRKGYYDALWNNNGFISTRAAYSTRFIRHNADRFLREADANDSQPWLLFLAPYAPHKPMEPETRYEKTMVAPYLETPAMDEEDRSDKHPYVAARTYPHNRSDNVQRMQKRTLKSVDDLVEQVFEQMHEYEEDENTLAFFLSDNGFMWGDHEGAGKGDPYTGSIQVPFFVRWPAGGLIGGEDPRLAANIDIAATILDAAGVTPQHPMDGRSLLDQTWIRDRLLIEFWKANGRPTWASTRTGSYQYIEFYDADESVPTFREYYDLEADPYQLTNVLADGDPSNDIDPIALTELSLQLRQDRDCSGSDCP